MTLISAFLRQRQVGFYEFAVSLVYTASSRPHTLTQWDHVSNTLAVLQHGTSKINYALVFEF